LCVEHGYDVVMAADEPEIESAAASLRDGNARTEAVQADLATEEGVRKLCEAIGGRPVSVLCANAGVGLGHAFLDQDWERARKVVDLNITGTILLVHTIG